MNDSRDPDDARLEEAAAWRGRRDTGDPPQGDRLAAWLAADPANAASFAQVERAAGAAAALKSDPAMMRLRAETQARLAASRASGVRPAIAAGVAAAVLVAGLVGWRVTRPPSATASAAQVAVVAGTVYATKVAQRRTVSLPDGSTAVLNTASRLRVVYTPGERWLVLESGQAFFDVAKDTARPFIVAAGDRTVTAHGTQFDVRLRPAGLDVALFRGAVTVARPGAAGAVALRPNQLLSIAGSRAVLAPTPRVAEAASWRDGEVTFDDTPLAEAVAQMNRYVERPAVVGSPGIADMRVSGAFRTDGMKAFLEALQAGFGVTVVASRDRDVILKGDTPQKK